MHILYVCNISQIVRYSFATSFEQRREQFESKCIRKHMKIK